MINLRHGVDAGRQADPSLLPVKRNAAGNAGVGLEDTSVADVGRH